MGSHLDQNRFYVYTYSYPNGGPFYVGKGCGRRLNVHLCDAKADRNKDSFVVRSVAKLLASGQTPVIKKIVAGVDNELACLVETEFVEKYGRRDIGTGVLTNRTDGGDFGAPNLSPETIKQRVKKHKVWLDANKHIVAENMRGNKNHFFGKTHTPEARKKIGVASTGRPKTLSEAAKSALSEMRIGEKNPMYGKKHTAETKAKFKNRTPARAWSGKKMTEAHKLKMSEAHRLLPSLECPHCGKVGGYAGMKRHHFDHCKMKETTCP